MLCKNALSFFSCFQLSETRKIKANPYEVFRKSRHAPWLLKLCSKGEKKQTRNERRDERKILHRSSVHDNKPKEQCRRKEVMGKRSVVCRNKKNAFVIKCQSFLH
jgi:U3 small nucleolar RNA-associated protein 14